MNTELLVVHIEQINADISRALEGLVHTLDTNQWVTAGVNVGRLMELGNRLAATCRLGANVVNDEWRKGQQQ